MHLSFNSRQDSPLTATVWMDSRPVAVLSTASSPVERNTNANRRLKDRTVVSVPRPVLVNTNHFSEALTFLTSYDQNIQLVGPANNGGNMSCTS